MKADSLADLVTMRKDPELSPRFARKHRPNRGTAKTP